MIQPVQIIQRIQPKDLYPALGLAALTAAVGCYQGRLDAGDAPDLATTTGRPEGDTDAAPPTESELPPEGDPRCAVWPARVWKLTASQYHHTVQALVPGVDVRTSFAMPHPGPSGFDNDATRLDMAEPTVAALLDAAEQVSQFVSSDASVLDACLPDGIDDPACTEPFVARWLALAFRRPPHDEEVERFSSYLEQQAATYEAEVALEQFVQAVLMSPAFLYRTEQGPAMSNGPYVRLTSYEIASMLSYTLTDGPPDAALRTAAERGELRDDAAVEAHVRRLLETRDRAPALLSLWRQLLDVRSLDGVEKDPEAFPRFGEPVRAAMERELDDFIATVLWDDDASLTSMLTASYTVVDPELAAFYGLPAPGPDGRVDIEGQPRAGVLTLGPVMTTRSSDVRTDIVGRGKFVRERLLCQSLPPPPPSVDATPPPFDPSVPHREQLREHSEDPTCAACHDLMDPLGFAFEHYDAAGRYRSEELGAPIDARGVLDGLDTPAVSFADAGQLGRILAGSPVVRNCVVQQTFRYVVGRMNTATDACVTEQLRGTFDDTDLDLRELIVALMSSELYLTRTVEP